MRALRYVYAFVAYSSLVAGAALLRPHHSDATLVVALVVLAYLFYLGARLERRRGAGGAGQSKAIDALQRGDLQTAEDAFNKLGHARDHVVAASSRHILAWTAMRRGKLAAALELYIDTDNNYEKELVASWLFAHAACDRAIVLALLGRVDDAELALREA
ncbi:MAG TPA: hypothetical protein VGG28_23720, partial [Kofleriaceae bacterium]